MAGIQDNDLTIEELIKQFKANNVKMGDSNLEVEKKLMMQKILGIGDNALGHNIPVYSIPEEKPVASVISNEIRRIWDPPTPEVINHNLTGSNKSVDTANKLEQTGFSIESLKMPVVENHVNASEVPTENLLDLNFASTSNSSHQRQPEEKKIVFKELNEIENRITNSAKTSKKEIEEVRIDDKTLIDQTLKCELSEKQLNSTYQEFLKKRSELPVFKMKETIINVIEKNKVVVISGSTGSGKTTQIAQIILDSEIMKGHGSKCRIVCTQPRRISAVSVAERVAQERVEEVGKDSSVGYQVRLEKKTPREHGSILFCTHGILLQSMRDDPELKNISHILMDEIHERDINSDFFLTVLREITKQRDSVKVVLMSATLNSESFSKYFNDCPSLDVPGVTFPVEEFYLEDVLEMTRNMDTTSAVNFRPPERKRLGFAKPQRSDNKKKDYNNMITPYLRELQTKKNYSDYVTTKLRDFKIEFIDLNLILRVVLHICQEKKKPGAILIFLPGWANISSLIELMKTSGKFPEDQYLILPLHSAQSIQDQRIAFERPPDGVRKIIVATNIAETSITIDDIVFVIDYGQAKISRFDPKKNVSTLNTEFISKANALQRRGRAGRMQAGECYYLFSKARKNKLQPYPEPEILRCRLEDIILHCKRLNFGKVKPFLQKCINPPSSEAIDVAVKTLIFLHALDSNENLTPLGQHLSVLPVDQQTAKMIILGALFKCIDPILSIAAALTFKDPFTMQLKKEKEIMATKVKFDKNRKSDLILLTEVFNEWELAEKNDSSDEFCSRNFLSEPILFFLRDIKSQLSDCLYNMKFLSSIDYLADEDNINSNNIGLIRAIIAASLYPNVAIVGCISGGKPAISTFEDAAICIHDQQSVNANVTNFESKVLVYYKKFTSNRVNIHDCTMVHPRTLLLFSHNIEELVENGEPIVKITNTNLSFKKMQEIDIMSARQKYIEFLERKCKEPACSSWDVNTEEGRLLRDIVGIISREEERIMGYRM